MTPSRRRRPAWYLEAPLLVGGYLAFGWARAAIDQGNPAATNNADMIQRAERALHVAVEHPINQAMLGHPVGIYLTGYFYRLCLVAVPAVLVWLFARQPEYYRHLRTVLVVITFVDLPLVWLFPESPPRFALNGIVDYIATHNILFGAATRTPNQGLNLLAAMPSMHIAWTAWCAYAVWSVLRPRRPRGAWLAWLYPLITAFVIVATGQHYILDIVGGVALDAIVIGLTKWFAPRRRPAGHGREFERTASSRVSIPDELSPEHVVREGRDSGFDIDRGADA